MSLRVFCVIWRTIAFKRHDRNSGCDLPAGLEHIVADDQTAPQGGRTTPKRK